MRTTRDTQLSEMSALKARLKEQNQRLVALSQEKARLEARNKMNMAADSANQEQVKLAFTNKQITLKQLRDRLQDLQKEVRRSHCKHKVVPNVLFTLNLLSTADVDYV